MRPSDRWIVSSGGVAVQAPFGLIAPDPPHVVWLLVVYGSPQQTRAIGARLATAESVWLETSDGERITLRRPDRLRMRGATIGPGRHRAVLWNEALPDETVCWVDETERWTALARALNRATVPFDPAWLPELESALIELDMLWPLRGWGGAGGYRVGIDADRLCTWLVERYRIGTVRPISDEQPSHGRDGRTARASSRRNHAAV